MITKKKRKTQGKDLAFKLAILGILVALSLTLAYSNYKLYQKKKIAQTKLSSLLKERERLIQERKKLEAQINIPKNFSLLEEKAREVYNLKKKGEKVAIILRENKDNRQKNSTQLIKSQNLKPKGIFQKIIDFLKSFPTDLDF